MNPSDQPVDPPLYTSFVAECMLFLPGGLLVLYLVLAVVGPGLAGRLPADGWLPALYAATGAHRLATAVALLLAGGAGLAGLRSGPVRAAFRQGGLPVRLLARTLAFTPLLAAVALLLWTITAPLLGALEVSPT